MCSSGVGTFCLWTSSHNVYSFFFPFYDNISSFMMSTQPSFCFVFLRLHKTDFFPNITDEESLIFLFVERIWDPIWLYFVFTNETILHAICLISTFQLRVYVQHWLCQPSRKFSRAPEWVFIGNAWWSRNIGEVEMQNRAPLLSSLSPLLETYSMWVHFHAWLLPKSLSASDVCIPS